MIYEERRLLKRELHICTGTVPQKKSFPPMTLKVYSRYNLIRVRQNLFIRMRGVGSRFFLIVRTLWSVRPNWMLSGVGLLDPKIHQSKIAPIMDLVHWECCHPNCCRLNPMVCDSVPDYRSVAVVPDCGNAD